MDFSRFFIDRPIFAAVLSIVIFAAGLIAIPKLPIGEVPGRGAAVGGGAHGVPGCQPQGDRRDRGDATGRGDQRRREHDVHFKSSRRFRRCPCS
jgi:hypothetical protein